MGRKTRKLQHTKRSAPRKPIPAIGLIRSDTKEQQKVISWIATGVVESWESRWLRLSHERQRKIIAVCFAAARDVGEVKQAKQKSSTREPENSFWTPRSARSGIELRFRSAEQAYEWLISREVQRASMTSSHSHLRLMKFPRKNFSYGAGQRFSGFGSCLGAVFMNILSGE